MAIVSSVRTQEEFEDIAAQVVRTYDLNEADRIHVARELIRDIVPEAEAALALAIGQSILNRL